MLLFQLFYTDKAFIIKIPKIRLYAITENLFNFVHISYSINSQ